MVELERPAGQTRKPVETSIAAVTVYVNQALITRRGMVSLTGQEQELLIEGLPARLQPESIQVSGIGTVTVQFQGARLEPIADSTDRFNLVVTVAPAGRGEFVLEVSYSVAEAGWLPLYDLLINPAGDQIHVQAVAEIRQFSQEDWTGVNLTLSTSELSSRMQPPTLQPWYVDLQPPDLMAAIGCDREEPPAQNLPKFAREGSILTVQLASYESILGDGTPHKLMVLSSDYACHLRYVALPRLTPCAYLQAIVTNPTAGMTLLAGKANLFRHNLLIGSLQLHTIAPGASWQLPLGLDEAVKTERLLVAQHQRQHWLKPRQIQTYTYRLTVSNRRHQIIPLKLTEQLPLSRHDQIQIRLISVSPPPALVEGSLLHWDLHVAPRTQQSITYQFAVEYPMAATIVGLPESAESG